MNPVPNKVSNYALRWSFAYLSMKKTVEVAGH